MLHIKSRRFTRHQGVTVNSSASCVVSHDSHARSKASAVEGIRARLYFSFGASILISSVVNNRLGVAGLGLSFSTALPRSDVVRNIRQGIIGCCVPFRIRHLSDLLQTHLSRCSFRVTFLPRKSALDHFGS